MGLKITLAGDLPTVEYPTAQLPDYTIFSALGAYFIVQGVKLLRSTDGLTWGDSGIELVSDAQAIQPRVFSGGLALFYSVYDSGLGDNRYYIATTTDGETLSDPVNLGLGGGFNNVITAWPTNAVMIRSRYNTTGTYFSSSSDGGETWSAEVFLAQPSSTLWWSPSPAYCNGVYVTWQMDLLSGTAATQVAYSANGVNWTATAAPLNTPKIVEGVGNFFFLRDGTYRSTIYTSTDGITWTSRSMGGSEYWTNAIVYTTGGKYAAVGNSTTHSYAYSSNGTSWTFVSSPPNDGTPNDNVAKFYVRGTAFVFLRGTKIYLSSTGASWTGYNLPYWGEWTLYFAGTNILAVNGLYTAYKSIDDFQSWETLTSTEVIPAYDGRCLATNGTDLVVLAGFANRRGYTYKSVDKGLTWTRSPLLPANGIDLSDTRMDGAAWSQIVYDMVNDRYLIISQNGANWLRSTDGLSWEVINSLPAAWGDYGWQGAYACPAGVFVYQQVTDNFARSTNAGTTWSPLTKPSGAYTFSMAYLSAGNKLFIGSASGVQESTNAGGSLSTSPTSGAGVNHPIDNGFDAVFAQQNSFSGGGIHEYVAGTFVVAADFDGSLNGQSAGWSAPAVMLNVQYEYQGPPSLAYRGHNGIDTGLISVTQFDGWDRHVTVTNFDYENGEYVLFAGHRYIIETTPPDWYPVDAGIAGYQTIMYFDGVWLLSGYMDDGEGQLTEDFETFTPMTTGIAGNAGMPAGVATPFGFVGLFDASAGLVSAVSPDGVNWTVGDTMTFAYSEGMAISPEGVIVAIGTAGGGGTHRIAYSTDGLNWTPVLSPYTSPDSWQYSRIAHNGNVFLIAIDDEFNAVSADGANWTVLDAPSNGGPAGIVGCSGRFVYTDYDGGVAYVSDDDGATWEPRTSGIPEGMYADFFTYSEGIIAGTGWGWGDAMVSFDRGDTWVMEALPHDDGWYAIGAHGDKFVTGSYNNTVIALRRGAVQGFWTGFVNCEETD